MIEKTFAYLATQPKETTCSINITEDDLQSHTLKNILIEAAQKYNITTNRIILEILEGVTATGAKKCRFSTRYYRRKSNRTRD